MPWFELAVGEGELFPSFLASPGVGGNSPSQASLCGEGFCGAPRPGRVLSPVVVIASCWPCCTRGLLERQDFVAAASLYPELSGASGLWRPQDGGVSDHGGGGALGLRGSVTHQAEYGEEGSE